MSYDGCSFSNSCEFFRHGVCVADKCVWDIPIGKPITEHPDVKKLIAKMVVLQEKYDRLLEDNEHLKGEQKKFRHKCTCNSQTSPYKCTCGQGVEKEKFYYMHNYINDKCSWCAYEPKKALARVKHITDKYAEAEKI